MVDELSVAPVLSTPAENILEYAAACAPENTAQTPQLSDDELRDVYEVARTAREIREGARARIALQFPDAMLRDAPRVVEALYAELDALPRPAGSPAPREKIYILADTSYSACCVDEVAAEHVDADVVVHYGRSCLSPTSRLPVIYVFTRHALDHQATLAAFEQQHPDKQSPVVLMADVTYQDHVPALAAELHARGYTNLLSTAIVRDPTGLLPNRRLVSPRDGADLPQPEDLRSHAVFHISQPPTALLLALSSRVRSLHIHPTSTSASASSSALSTQRLLGRRYARVLSLASAGIIGILVNTLSVADYLASVEAIRRRVAAAGKKSYTVVVGKLNAAKLANFAEVDGWVVVGCWESALVEDDAGFYRPVVTPFELAIALMRDEERTWSGEWWGGIERVTAGVEGLWREGAEEKGGVTERREGDAGGVGGAGDEEADEGDGDEEEGEESAPPEFDLRTGKLISHSRPMRQRAAKAGKRADGSTNGTGAASANSAVALRPKAELATVNGVVSPGAEFLRAQRTWQGLGSDYVPEESTAIEEGRSGIARGYTIGDDQQRR